MFLKKNLQKKEKRRRINAKLKQIAKKKTKLLNLSN